MEREIVILTTGVFNSGMKLLPSSLGSEPEHKRECISTRAGVLP